MREQTQKIVFRTKLLHWEKIFLFVEGLTPNWIPSVPGVSVFHRSREILVFILMVGYFLSSVCINYYV